MKLEEAIKRKYEPKFAPIERTTMTVNDVAGYIGLSDEFVYQLVRQKQIPFLRVGRRILFKKVSIDNWLNDLECEPVIPE